MSKKSRTPRKKQKSCRHQRPREHQNKHHVYARSRKKLGSLGKFSKILGSLKLSIEIRKHNAWHHLFANLFSEEVIALMKNAANGGHRPIPEIISYFKRHHKKDRAIVSAIKEDEEAWRKVFGSNASFRQIRRIIIRDWTYPGVRAIVSENGHVTKVMLFIPKIAKSKRIEDAIHHSRNVRVIHVKKDLLLKLI